MHRRRCDEASQIQAEERSVSKIDLLAAVSFCVVVWAAVLFCTSHSQSLLLGGHAANQDGADAQGLRCYKMKGLGCAEGLTMICACMYPVRSGIF